MYKNNHVHYPFKLVLPQRAVFSLVGLYFRRLGIELVILVTVWYLPWGILIILRKWQQIPNLKEATNQADDVVDDVSTVQLAAALRVESHCHLHVWQALLVRVILRVLRQLLKYHNAWLFKNPDYSQTPFLVKLDLLYIQAVIQTKHAYSNAWLITYRGF